jgi:hypothetical protein
MQKSKEIETAKQADMVKEGPETERGLINKESLFLPQVSLASKKKMKAGGGAVRLKANYYK